MELTHTFMTIEIKNADKVVERIRARLLDGADRRLQLALEAEKAEIDKRTTSGRDVDGGAFDEYSEGYAKFKAKRGRKASPPDLTFTGSMLRAMTVEVTREGQKLIGRIFFNSAREAAKAAGNMRTRRFFGLSRDQIKRIVERLKSP